MNILCEAQIYRIGKALTLRGHQLPARSRGRLQSLTLKVGDHPTYKGRADGGEPILVTYYGTQLDSVEIPIPKEALTHADVKVIAFTAEGAVCVDAYTGQVAVHPVSRLVVQVEGG